MTSRLIIAAALTGLAATVAFAQDIGQREPVMKDIARNFGALNKMNRGQTPYDAAAAKAAFQQIAASSHTFGTLFTSTPTPKDRSLPSIWEKKADFDARNAKLMASAKAGAATHDEAGFKAAFADLGPQCGGCHKVYRGD